MKPHRGSTKIDSKNLLAQAIAQHQNGNLADAARLYLQILLHSPKHFDALHLLGVIAVQQKDFEQGLRYIDQAIAVNANYAVAFDNRGSALKGLQRLEAAIQSYDRAIQLKPDYAEAYNARGILQHELKDYASADESFRNAIRINPQYAHAHNNLGILLHTMSLNQTTEDNASQQTTAELQDRAVSCFNKAIEFQPDYAEAHNNFGNLWRLQKNYNMALESFDRAIALQPAYSEAFNNRGNALSDLGRFAEAVASYDQAIAINPGYSEAYSNRGNALSHNGQNSAAICSYDQAIACRPDVAETYNNRGNTFTRLKKPYAAIDDYDRAIKLKPDYAEAYNNCGNVFKGLRQFPVALLHYEKAIQLKPGYADAYANRAHISNEVGQVDLAIESWDEALKYEPDNARFWVQRGHSLVTAKKQAEAIESFEHAFTMDPEHDYLIGTLVQNKWYISDWATAEPDRREVEQRVSSGIKSVVPFSFLAFTASEQLQLTCAQSWINNQVPEDKVLGPILTREKNRKIRVGYFSADFRHHPVAYLIAELFELHDRNAFEIVAFSMGGVSQDDVRLRLEKAFDQFIEIDSKTDQEVALLAREMKIDIAVDLTGFTARSRTGIFAMRAAPVQITYLGYPSTLGADYIDYIIADETVIPVESQKYFTEKIAYLPDTYMVNDSKRKISDKQFTRSELGLPESGFVFCCFNNSYKVTPQTFDGWMRILQQVPGSVLWLAENNAISAANLRKEAGARNVSPDRLIFAKRMESLADHLARHRLADLFIDTLPFNAHTTASDALWAGLPVLTCIGTTFAGRVAASLLKAIELPELIASTQEEYEAMAVEFATNPEKLQAIRQKLDNNRLTTALFDARRFTKNIENIYRQMHENQHADSEITHLNIIAA
jgi:predicted O-linked N-acetylglucosamine transferase (SPINDLY family)